MSQLIQRPVIPYAHIFAVTLRLSYFSSSYIIYL